MAPARGSRYSMALDAGAGPGPNGDQRLLQQKRASYANCVSRSQLPKESDWLQLYDTQSPPTGPRTSPMEYRYGSATSRTRNLAKRSDPDSTQLGATHRRTASLDNILDQIKQVNLTTPTTSTTPTTPTTPTNRVRNWSPVRASSSKLSVCDDTRSVKEDTVGLKTRLKTISDRYLKKPPTTTLTSTLLSKLRSSKNKSTTSTTSSTSWYHRSEDQKMAQRSSFRSFSCGTLPALDEFQRKKMLMAATSPYYHDRAVIAMLISLLIAFMF